MPRNVIKKYLPHLHPPAPVHQDGWACEAVAHAGPGVAPDGRKVSGAAVKRDVEIDIPHENIAGAVDEERVERVAGCGQPDRPCGVGAGPQDGARVFAVEDERGGKSEVVVELEDNRNVVAVLLTGSDVRKRADCEGDI